MIHTEVLIIGGGPAGSACARRLHDLGMSCLVLDRETFPRPKPCAGWVTPQVFKLLKVSPEEYPHGLTHFGSFQVSIKGIKFRLPTHQYAIRRVAFDAWLLSQAGVEPVQHHVKTIQQTQNEFVVDNKFTAKFIVGAGGTHCPVRRQYFNPTFGKRESGLIIAKEEEFVYPVKDERCHLWFFEDGLPGYAWYVPKANGFVNVGIGASAKGLQRGNRTLNGYWEKHLQRLESMGLVKDHSYDPAGYSYYLRQSDPIPQKGNVYLVGDALGLATRDMGEGIGPAIHSGILAAEAIKEHTPYLVKSVNHYSFPSLLRLTR